MSPQSRSDVRFLHRLLEFGVQVTVQSNVLIDRQGFTPGMTCEQLKFGIGHSRMSGQPCYALMAKCVWRGRNTSLLGIELDDLLDSPRRVLRITAGLKQPSVVGVGGDVRSQCRAERLAEQNKPIFVTLPVVDSNLVIFNVDVANLDAAQLRHANGSLEQQSKHQLLHNDSIYHRQL